MAGKKKNPRRTVLVALADMKRLLERSRNIWNVSSTVWESGTHIKRCDPKHYPGRPVGDDGLVEVEFWASTTRKREAHEYPENTKEDWAVLVVDMEDLIEKAEALKHIARCKRDHLHWPDRIAPCGCDRITLNGASAIQHSYRQGVCLDGETGYQLV